MIQRADPQARRRAILMVLVTIPLALTGYVLLEAWLAELASQPAREARQGIAAVIRWGTTGIAAMVALLAACAYRLGRRIARTQRFPPPGASVIRDTRIVEGGPARNRGLLIQAIAAAMLLVASLLPFAAFSVARLLHGVDGACQVTGAACGTATWPDD